jgi:hypothetical protein
VRSLSYQRKIGDKFFPELLVYHCFYYLKWGDGEAIRLISLTGRKVLKAVTVKITVLWNVRQCIIAVSTKISEEYAVSIFRKKVKVYFYLFHFMAVSNHTAASSGGVICE